MTHAQNRRAMTASEIREQLLGDTRPVPIVRATRYEVSLLPVDDINRKYFTLYIEARGEQWTVCNAFRECLSTNGEWTHESVPADGTEAWLAAHRLELSDALKLANTHAPGIYANGRTAAEVYAATYGNGEQFTDGGHILNGGPIWHSGPARRCTAPGCKPLIVNTSSPKEQP